LSRQNVPTRGAAGNLAEVVAAIKDELDELEQ
jgi:hypothetical protein